MLADQLALAMLLRSSERLADEQAHTRATMLADEQARAITSCPASGNILGNTDVLYLENYEELTNWVCTSKKIVILTLKNIFWEPDS